MSTDLTLVDQKTEQSHELVVSAQEAMAVKEIEAAIIVAQRFPRNEMQTWQQLIQSAKRPSFAEAASYNFPRGGKDVTGPSVHLARAAARAWGNIRYGIDVLSDSEEMLHIRGWAWDIQTNAKVHADDSFKKLIYRKNGGWQKPDERDLRELINRRGAILERNCLLKLIPRDIIDDVLATCEHTIVNGVRSDPDRSRKKAVAELGSFGVKVPDINAYLGKPIEQATAEEIAKLHQIACSIRDGQSRWSDYLPQPTAADPKGPVSVDDLINAQAAKEPTDDKRPVNTKPPEEAHPSGAGADDMFDQGGPDEDPGPTLPELQARIVALIAQAKLTKGTIDKQMTRYKVKEPGELSIDDAIDYVKQLERIIARDQKG